MVATDLLVERIEEKGLLQKDVARMMKLTKSGFSLKIHNKRPLTLEEAEELKKILEIPDKDLAYYFFN